MRKMSRQNCSGKNIRDNTLRHEYPLGLGLEDWVQPQGSLNFTRVENATLQLTLTNASAANPVNVLVWGINFNFLKVERGVAGLIYAA